MEIRPRTDEDINACVALGAAVRAADGYPPYVPYPLREFLVTSDAQAAWVAEAGGTILGHVALHRTSTEPVMALATASLGVPRTALGVVARLFVATNRRGEGIGGRLLETAAGAARTRGLTPILDVATMFPPAIALYERHGWERLGLVTIRFHGEDLDEFVYAAPTRRATRINRAGPPLS